MRNYATDFTAMETGWASQGAADWCAEHGHATFTKDGVDMGICPRCLDVTKPATPDDMTLVDDAQWASDWRARHAACAVTTEHDMGGDWETGYLWCEQHAESGPESDA